MSDDRVLLDEFHVSVYVPADLPDDEAAGVRAALAGEGVRRELRRAVRRRLRRDGVTLPVAVRVTR